MTKLNEQTEQIVGVWYDDSNQDDRAWCVCDETVFPDGETDTTSTISMHDTREDAVAAGRARADRRGVRLVIASEDGGAA